MGVQPLGKRDVLLDGKDQLTVSPAHPKLDRVDLVVMHVPSGRYEIIDGQPGDKAPRPTPHGTKIIAVLRIPAHSLYLQWRDITEV